MYTSSSSHTSVSNARGPVSRHEYRAPLGLDAAAGAPKPQVKKEVSGGSSKPLFISFRKNKPTSDRACSICRKINGGA
jgi:hypothetical protein